MIHRVCKYKVLVRVIHPDGFCSPCNKNRVPRFNISQDTLYMRAFIDLSISVQWYFYRAACVDRVQKYYCSTVPSAKG